MAIGAIKSIFTEKVDTVSALNPFQLTEKESYKSRRIEKSNYS